MQTLGCSPFLNTQDYFFFCERIPFLKYNFLIQDRGWKIFWEGGSSLIFPFLPVIQICIICCMLYSDCRTTCQILSKCNLGDPETLVTFFFLLAALTALSERISHRHTSKQPGLTRDVWAPNGLWSCPQLSSAALTSSYLPAPAARSTGLCSSWPLSPSHTAYGAGHVDRMGRWGYPTPFGKCLQANKR